MEEGIAGQSVRVTLCPALGVDGTGNIGELTEDIEAVKGEQQAALHQRTSQTGISYEISAVHLIGSVATTGVGSEVGGKFYLQR